ncbi:Nicotinate-nucleotide--dimethylbenzimidazole phosphoribosyltransferase [Streptomyces griseoloalbus]
MRDVLEGGRPVSVLARRLGVPVRVVDMALDCDPVSLPEDVVRHRVRRGSGRIDVEDALTAEEAEAAFRAGMAVADEEADSGTDLVVLGDVSVGGTTAAGAGRGAVRDGRVGGDRARRDRRSTTWRGCASARRSGTRCGGRGRCWATS